MEVKISNLTYVKEKKIILNNINYVFKQGVNIIMGHSCGKSTLLELIDYLDTPSKGSISIGNIKLTKHIKTNKLRLRIGYLFQKKETSFFSRNVYEEVAFGLKHFKIKCDYNKRVSDTLKLVGLNDSYLGVSPFNLSYGEKNKLALACLLVTDPDIILLDEPTLGLDGKSKNNFLSLLHKLKLNKVIIIASNDIEFISKISDKVIVMDKGNIIYNGKLKELYKSDIVNNLEIPYELELIKYILENKNIKLEYKDSISKLCKEIKKHV